MSLLPFVRKGYLALRDSGWPTIENGAEPLRETKPQSFDEPQRDMGIEEILSTPRSPWQRAYVERVIGTLRRECLDHVIVFDEGALRRTLAAYFDYYHRSRTHLSLGKDAPETRPIHPPEIGPVVSLPQVGGLHHRYERQAA